MVKLIEGGVYVVNGNTVIPDSATAAEQVKKASGKKADLAEAYKGTISYGVLQAHNTLNTAKGQPMRLKFDALASHDITYVGIIQTARASGLTAFPVPYVLTNCHNSLCAVGGTINEDDHVFGLTAAKKYGGIYVPPHIAVIHQYMREKMAGCGKMILGSDSHTRYGAMGTMAVGEGGPELVKQVLGKTYDAPYPGVVAVVLSGTPRRGVGPQDVALAIIGAVFKNGFVKNKVMEFVGDGVKNLTGDYRCGIDVMTTETACLSSVWRTDDEGMRDYFAMLGRSKDYKPLRPADVAYYDGAVMVDLDKVEPMIAMPFHPSNMYRVADVIAHPGDVMREVEKGVRSQMERADAAFSLTDKVQGGALYVDQSIIAGCAGGTYENLAEAAKILKGKSTGNGAFTLSLYPASQPVYQALVRSGLAADIMETGAVLKTAFCGPCFGAGDTPANNAFSIRHTTRNFPSREGSKPGQGQTAFVALMDARSIAATSVSGGKLTSALDLDYDPAIPQYFFDGKIYENRVFVSSGPDAKAELKFGPNIADWPEQAPLAEDVLLRIDSAIFDPVTTTDELIPSGETSSYRSNPLKLAEFALSRKDPGYVGRAKETQAVEKARRNGDAGAFGEALAALKADATRTGIGSCVFAVKPGDGSAREQAASCQRVLGGLANIASEYATKRYRSNLINWGMLPFLSEDTDFAVGDLVFIPNVRERLERGETEFPAKRLRNGSVTELTLKTGELTDAERKIILSGCLINFYNL